MNRSSQVAVVAIAAILSALSALPACTTGQPKSNDSAPQPEPKNVRAEQAWAEKMQSLSQTLSNLMPLVVSRTKFNNEKNFEKIESETKNLQALAHSLKAGAPPNADPSMRMMTGLFEEDIERAIVSLRSGNREYARQVLQDTTSYCIQCHTQTNNGPDFPHLNLSINTQELNLLEQAEFYAATRQFDKALAAYEKALSDESLAKADPFQWEQAARSALAIVVRVKRDPKEAATMLAKIEAHRALPAATKQALGSWKKTVREWGKEKAPEPASQKEALTRAESLIKRAQKRQEFPLDHSQDVVYFRASSLLHELLQNSERGTDTSARALYWAGVAAEATRDMNFWTLHETYYEQCIRTVPHTKQAEQCYDRLKESVTLGYSGSGGVRIPPEVSKRLETFKTLASTATATKTQ